MADDLDKQKLVPHDSINIIPHPIWQPIDSEITATEAREKLGIPHDVPVFLLFGLRPLRQKSIDIVVEALAQVKLPLKLIIAGKGDNKAEDDELLAQIGRVGLKSAVDCYFRYIEESEIPYFFNASDALVLPYKKTYIGSSGVLAMACRHKIPVVASNVGDLGSMVHEYELGTVFEPDQVSSLVEAVKFFIANLENRDKYTKNMNILAESRSWSNVVKEHVVIYEKQNKQNFEGILV